MWNGRVAHSCQPIPNDSSTALALGYAIFEMLDLRIDCLQSRCVTSLPHFERRRPLVELGDERCPGFLNGCENAIFHQL